MYVNVDVFMSVCGYICKHAYEFMYLCLWVGVGVDVGMGVGYGYGVWGVGVWGVLVGVYRYLHTNTHT
jgi:hypothetical protein